LPLYEYACTQCGQHIEKIQKFSDPPLTRCEKCGGSLKRVLSSPAIQFKGSGWYVTDYARKSSTVTPDSPAGSGNGGKGKSSAVARTEGHPTKTSEDKPAAEKSK
jgi:putative FmdB family regulatory protein